MLTDGQLALIKTKIIWMSGRPQPSAAYVEWWEQQDPLAMEQQAVRLICKQAYRLIAEARQGHWQKVIELWQLYTPEG